MMDFVSKMMDFVSKMMNFGRWGNTSSSRISLQESVGQWSESMYPTQDTGGPLEALGAGLVCLCINK